MWPFNRKKKEQESNITPAQRFTSAVTHVMTLGLFGIHKQTSKIDELSNQISELMEKRGKLVQERSELVETVNKQRNLLGLEEVDEEGVALSEQPADDENYALES